MELCNFTYSLLKRRLFSLVVLGLMSLIAAGTAQAQGTINFKVRDQQTGFSVAEASVLVFTEADRGAAPVSVHQGNDVSLSLEEGYYRFVFKAPGYEEMETYFKSETGHTLNVSAKMDPLTPTSAMYQRIAAGTAMRSQGKSDEVIIEGYVSDKDTGNPLANVQIAIGPRTAKTDSEGYFRIASPVAADVLQRMEVPGNVPDRSDITFTKDGYRTHLYQDFNMVPDVFSIQVSMEKGHAGNRTAPTKEHQEHGQLGDKPFEKPEPSGLRNPFAQTQAAGATAPPMPSTIRVGMNCDGYCNCSYVDVYDFETYVQRGLENEWFSWWNYTSHKAGAVAYRTYAAYHTVNPYRSNYDITSNTCRQAYGNETAQSTVNAAIETAGEVLVYNNGFAFSEYSSENNAKACADGYAGDNNVYACFSDGLCTGSTPNGHGRGMCQYGSMRWGNNGNSYTWILDHYYNRNGIYRSTGGSSGGGGTNIATSASVYSHTSDYGAGYTAWQAVDGTTNTKWVSNGVNTYQAMYLNLNGYFNINKFVLKHAGAGGEWAAMNTAHYTIYYWTGSAWASVVNYYNTQQHNETSHNVNISAQYVYLAINDPGNADNYTRLPEWEIYGSSASRAQLQPEPPLNNTISSLIVFPNPAEDRISVQFGQPREQAYTLTLVDIHGREVYAQNYDNSDSSRGATIGVSGLKPGIYLLTVNGAEGTETIRCQVK